MTYRDQNSGSDLTEVTMDYLSHFTGGLEGSLTLWNKRTLAHTSFRSAQLREAAVFALATSAAEDDIYVRGNLQENASGTKASTVSALTVVTIDFDVLGPGHKEKRLPGSRSDLARLLAAAGIPMPTVTLDTGGGLLGVWALEQPMMITSEVDRTAAKKLSAVVQGRVRQLATIEGLVVDRTGDLVRAGRILGTRNWKKEYGPGGLPVNVYAGGGDLLAAEDLHRIAEEYDRSSAEQRRSRRPKAAAANGEPKVTGNISPSWPAVQSGCDALRAWAATEDGLPEPQWYALAGIVGHCAGGTAIFHGLSAGDTRYSEEETDAKVSQAVNASPPRLCSSIEELGGDCTRCPFRGRISSPIALGFAANPYVVGLARRWVYVAAQDAFMDLYDLEDAA